MAWVYIIVAGLFEAGWAVGLKLSQGFSKPIPSALTVIAIVASMLLLGHGVRSLPIGTAYAVWVGIGSLGAAILGIVLFHESASPARLFFLGLLLVSIVGLKATSPSPPASDRADQAR